MKFVEAMQKVEEGYFVYSKTRPSKHYGLVRGKLVIDDTQFDRISHIIRFNDTVFDEEWEISER